MGMKKKKKKRGGCQHARILLVLPLDRYDEVHITDDGINFDGTGAQQKSYSAVGLLGNAKRILKKKVCLAE